MNDTPETDAKYLERERNAARAEQMDEAREKLAAVTGDLQFRRQLYVTLTERCYRHTVELAKTRVQRDRLAEALLELRNNESFSLGGAANEIVEQALKSLTPNEL